MPTEHEFTAEYDVDSKDHENELERVSQEQQNRADKALRTAIDSVVTQNKKIVSDLQKLTATVNNFVAQDAMKSKVSEQVGVTTTDKKTGATDLAAREAKVKAVIDTAKAADKSNSNGEAHEAKLGKLAAFAAIVTAGGPLMLHVFQILRKAMAGEDISGELGDAASEALIMALVMQWQNETDDAYWDDFANFFKASTATKAALTGKPAVPPDPTSADLVLILHYSSILNPVPATAGFAWASSKEKTTAVDALTGSYKVNSKETFIRSLAKITVSGNSVPRGIQAQLGELAVANAI
jgi:hypothetical protein